MKKIILVFMGLGISLNAFSLDSKTALTTFHQELTNIRTKLQTGKMNAVQAQILLQAIEVRQNNVIIAQNAEILRRMKNESK